MQSAKGLGPVVQLVRTLACHARGRGFEPHPNRQKREKAVSRAAERRTTAGAGYASVAQLVEQRTENPRVVGSIPTGGTILLAPESKQFDSDGRHQMRA